MTLAQYIKRNVDANFDGELPFKTIGKGVNKNSVFTNFKQAEECVYFLKSGIVVVEIETEKERKILDFFFENSFFASYSSLLLGTLSDVRISAFTDCTVEVINYEELKETYKSSLIANKLGRIETEKLFTRKVSREKELLTKTAEQRYLTLINSKPEIVKQIPVKDISRYLGIKPESLSRIRQRIIS
ncbi:MAG: cyclic nucleotide-binding domain-containing protein [Tunicatimonas sp.]|uniref:Crp/Fnr family transcriptional regulator n=1 Tax=Tunicatimonas sp. TaxID=1940096 RepID=UPI003C78F991